jgi:hypothetical protein
LEQLKRLSEIEKYLFMIEETRKKKNELEKKSQGEKEERWKSSIPDILAFSSVDVDLEKEKNT